ncbi:MAG: heme-dependent oxidative N-demethylase subunit alpha family protein [Rhodospirillaceae bacterium]
MRPPAPTAADFDPLRIGLAPLEMEAWLHPRPGDGALLAQRAQLAADHPADVLALTPAGAAPVEELAETLRGRGMALPAGDAAALLPALAGAVAEDLLLLTQAEGPYVLSAGVLCFPNRWRLADKVGHGLTAIHEPVPAYAHALARQVDHFLERLRRGRAFVRGNWGLASSPALHLPLPVAPVDPEAETGFFLRREEQSFVKLQVTGAVVFAIRTTVVPWERVPEAERAAIREAAAGLSPPWRAYKSLK